MAADARSLAALLDDLAAGERPSAVDLTLLSSIDREDLGRLSAAWSSVPLDLREDVLVRTTELAEDNVDLDFAGLARLALEDADATVRRRAVEALWENEDRVTAARLTALVGDDPDETVRAAAALALGAFVLLTELGQFDPVTGERAVEALRERATDLDESVDVRGRAIESLGARSLPWIETIITDAYYAEDGRLQMAAIRGMGASAQERWFEYLEEAAVSDDPEVRFEVAQAYGAIGSEDATEMLSDMLGDEDRQVVIAALVSLGDIGGEGAVEVLDRFTAEVNDEDLQETAKLSREAATFAAGDDLFRRGLVDES